ncbi:MAG: hypothetical protein F6J93_37605 [Oscillatoria sp. SIO1A7]|nr:hypothetical protein [Oscillatoria sp. SIO1A7]
MINIFYKVSFQFCPLPQSAYRLKPRLRSANAQCPMPNALFPFFKY